MISFLDHNIGRLMAALEEAGLMDSTRGADTSDHGDNLVAAASGSPTCTRILVARR